MIHLYFLGSNLLLQRIMVKRGVQESDLTFVAFDSTTSLCTSSYVSYEPGVCPCPLWEYFPLGSVVFLLYNLHGDSV